MRLDSSSDRHIAVQRARRHLLDSGPVASLTGVEPWIAESWKRCLASGKQPEQSIVFAPNALISQKRVIDQHQALIAAAKPILQNLGDLVAGIGYFALLTNAQGLVIDVAGSVDRSDPMAGAIAQVGVDLSEDSAGTSAISTALRERHPVWLHQHEHFFDATSVYSCAGAPLFDPRGHCLGMLDLTGIRVREQRQLVHLVSQYACEIERAVLMREKHALLLQVNWPGQLGGVSAGGLMSVDGDGQILGADQLARQMIPDLQQLHAGSVHLSDIFATSSAAFFDQARQSRAQSEQPLWSGLSLLVESVKAELPKPEKKTSRPASMSLKIMQSELIQQALQEAKGNVELASIRLGISRATLYRKLQRHRDR
jgi:sigma-54 dependent transcriptional regulator, acetoin dehydrogenase operon transcriptional activator AcoR